MGNNSLAYTRDTAVKTFTGSEKTWRLRYVVIYYCPRQGRIRCFGQGKPFVLNADASRSQSRSPWASRSCPKRTASLFLGKNASNHRQTGCLAASRELSQTGAIPAAGDFPVQNSDRQNVSWTRVMEYRIETSPRTAVSARRSSIIRSQEFS
jgi:hypothetical protein